MSASNNITPDAPEMRSVMIRPPPSSLMVLPSRSFISKEESPGSSRVVWKQSLNKHVPSWTPNAIPALPECYPLERTHIYVVDVSAHQVATRITDRLRVDSVAVQYDGVSASSNITIFETHNGSSLTNIVRSLLLVVKLPST